MAVKEMAMQGLNSAKTALQRDDSTGVLIRRILKYLLIFFVLRWAWKKHVRPGLVKMGILSAPEDNRSWWEKLMGFVDPTGTAGGDYKPPGTNTNMNTSASDKVRKLVDNIYESLKGINMFQHPDVVNRIANLSDNECKVAYYYWNNKYRAGNGSLYDFIAWDDDLLFGSSYQPALDKLKKLGLHG